MTETDHIMKAWDEIFDFLMTAPTPEQIATFKLSDAVQGRLELLLDKNKRTRLTEGEEHELDEYQRMNHMMMLFKARAQEKLVLAKP